MARSMQLNNNQGQIKMKGLKNMKMRMLATVLIVGVCLSMQADDAAYRKALSEAKMAEAEKKADAAHKAYLAASAATNKPEEKCDALHTGSFFLSRPHL